MEPQEITRAGTAGATGGGESDEDAETGTARVGAGGATDAVCGGRGTLCHHESRGTPNPLVTESIAPGEKHDLYGHLQEHRLSADSGHEPVARRAGRRHCQVRDGRAAEFPPVVKPGQSVTFGVVVTVPGDAPVGVSDGDTSAQRVLPNGKVKEVWRAEALPVSVEVVGCRYKGGAGTVGVSCRSPAHGRPGGDGELYLSLYSPGVSGG